MSQRANPKIIGAFVIGAVVLAIGAVAVFASGQFFQTTRSYVAFFPHSVQGLQIGAPVAFRGVQIGAVTNVVVKYDVESNDINVPVFFDIIPARVLVVGEQTFSDEVEIEQLINRGMRAQLQQQSLVTGQQAIQLDFFPDEPAVYVGGIDDVNEFPAIASSMEQLQESLSSVAEEAPVLLSEATDFISSAGELLDDRNKAAFANILLNLESFSATLAESDEKIATILDDTAVMAGNLRDSSVKVEDVMATIADNRERIIGAVEEIGAAGEAVTRMADQVNNMVAENRQGLKDFTNEGLYEFTGLAQDGQDMANQITRVASELERDPGRFFFGDQQQGVDTR